MTPLSDQISTPSSVQKEDTIAQNVAAFQRGWWSITPGKTDLRCSL